MQKAEDGGRRSRVHCSRPSRPGSSPQVTRASLLQHPLLRGVHTAPSVLTAAAEPPAGSECPCPGSRRRLRGLVGSAGFRQPRHMLHLAPLAPGGSIYPCGSRTELFSHRNLAGKADRGTKDPTAARRALRNSSGPLSQAPAAAVGRGPRRCCHGRTPPPSLTPRRPPNVSPGRAPGPAAENSPR